MHDLQPAFGLPKVPEHADHLHAQFAGAPLVEEEPLEHLFVIRDDGDIAARNHARAPNLRHNGDGLVDFVRGDRGGGAPSVKEQGPRLDLGVRSGCADEMEDFLDGQNARGRRQEAPLALIAFPP